MSWFPEAGDIVAIFERIRASEAGIDLSASDGLIDLDSLDVVMDLVRHGLPIMESDILTRAALLIRELLLRQLFTNGNKHVGFAAMILFLLENGYEWRDEVEFDERFCLEIAKGTLVELDEIRAVLHERSMPASST